MIIALAAALLAPTQGAVATIDPAHEPVCVVEVERGNAKRQTRLDRDAAATLCRRQFGWSDDLTRRAVEIAEASDDVRLARSRASAAGLDLSQLDSIWDELTPDQIIGFGFPRTPSGASPEKVASVRAMDERLAAHGLAKNLDAATVLITRALAANALVAFIAAKQGTPVD